MPRPIWWSLGLLLCWCSLAPAQGIPVYDNTNFLQNIITSAQTTITAVQSVAQTTAALEELTPLDEIVVAQGIAEDLAALADIVRQAEGLSYDVASLQRQLDALFDLHTAPASTSELNMRLAEMRRMRYQSYSYAMRLQTLMRTALRTIDHLVLLVNSVAHFLGAKQGMQTLVQLNATISKTLTIQATQTAAYERAGSIDKMEELVTMESLHRINAETMADWPRRERAR